MTLGQRIEEIRKDKGLGATWLFREVRISHVKYRQIIDGKIIPSREEIFRFAFKLDTPVDELLLLAGHPIYIEPEPQTDPAPVVVTTSLPRPVQIPPLIDYDVHDPGPHDSTDWFDWSAYLQRKET